MWLGRLAQIQVEDVRELFARLSIDSGQRTIFGNDLNNLNDFISPQSAEFAQSLLAGNRDNLLL